MRNSYSIVATTAAFVFLVAGVATARITADWPYEKLFRESDVVVFAIATSTDPADDSPPKHPFSDIELVAQNTTFKTKHVLKGQLDAEQIRLLHFKIGKTKRNNIVSGPLLVTFDSGGVGPKEYLLFLKRLGDGRFEPVSGQIDSMFSVREISRTSISE